MIDDILPRDTNTVGKEVMIAHGIGSWCDIRLSHETVFFGEGI